MSSSPSDSSAGAAAAAGFEASAGAASPDAAGAPPPPPTAMFPRTSLKSIFSHNDAKMVAFEAGTETPAALQAATKFSPERSTPQSWQRSAEYIIPNSASDPIFDKKKLNMNCNGGGNRIKSNKQKTTHKNITSHHSMSLKVSAGHQASLRVPFQYSV